MGLKEDEDKLFGTEPVKPAGTEPAKPPEGEEPPKPPSVLESKLDGEGIPEEYRGKSVSDILEELKTAKAQPVQPTAPTRPAEGAKPAAMTLEELEKLSYTQPLKASAILFQTLSEPLVKELRGTGERFAKQEIAKKDHYKRFEKEIEGVAAQLDPSLRTNPEAWEKCYDMVVGRHVKELVGEVAQGTTTISGGNPPPPQSEKVVLNDEQKRIADQLGLKEEDYIAGMKR